MACVIVFLPEHSIKQLGLKQSNFDRMSFNEESSRAFHQTIRIETGHKQKQKLLRLVLPEHSIKQLGLKLILLLYNRHKKYLPEHSIKQLGLKH